MKPKKKASKRTFTISDYLEIAPRYVRSFEIERDLTDPAATDGYVLTPAVIFATQTLARGLRKDSTQRAWRVTGPYGAGKSAFGLFLAHIAAHTTAGRKLLDQLKDEAPDVYATWQATPRYFPLAITGSRIPFGHALITRLRRAVEGISTRRPPRLLHDLKHLESRALSGRIGDEEVNEALKQFSAYVTSASQEKYEGVLLLIDEMGKFLEYAALKPEQADAHVFQRIAEMAAGGSKQPLAIIGFLHQNFADYAVGYGERAQEEWSKVAQRFEDIPFDESLEQYGFLLGKAMQYKSNILKTSGIENRSRELYARALQEKNQSEQLSALVKSSPNLYPLHPSTFLALATAAKRFGQNQRSLFSFLLAGEAYGLQQFIRSTELSTDNWYRLPLVYDYLASLDGVTFRQGDRVRKWDLLRDTLAHGPKLEPLESDLLKTVGLLNVLDPVPYLITDARTLSRTLTDTESSKDVRDALAALVRKKVLFYRDAQGDYCVWRHSSVDLQTLYEDAARSTRSITNLDDLLGAMGEGRSIIAHRHYQRTGTLRAFRVRYVSMAQLSALTNDQPINEYDGEVLVVLLEPGATAAKVAAEINQHVLAANAARLIVLRKIEQADLKLATEIRIYDRIRQSCAELRVDDFARREVDQNLDRARRHLEGRLAKVASLAETAESQDIIWLYRGKIVQVKSRAELSLRLSNICDLVYASSPVIHNELINRHKLSSAISLARQRLIGAMLARPNEAGLGLTGLPPERAIYLSLFLESGLHRKDSREIGFHPPRANADPCGWGSAWRGLREQLTKQGAVSFEETLGFLRQPPYGMREGPALLLIIAFILSERRNIALFERNTYLVNFTEDHIQRLIKSPANFGLHLQPAVKSVQNLFGAYAIALQPIKERGDVLTDANSVVSCLYRWHASLSEYALQTLHLSPVAKEIRSVLKRAMDPVDLVTKNLPTVCGQPDVDKATKKSLEEFAATLSSALQEIHDADVTLRRQVLFVLNDAFGIKKSVAELRGFLRDNFGPFKDALGDHKLKAALTRAIDKQLSNEAWIESMAALLGERSISLWKDETLDRFKAETVDFAGKLSRWAALMHKLKSKPNSASLVSVYVTGTSGKEHALLVTDPPQVRASSEELKKALKKVIEMNPEEAPLALAQTLAEVLSGSITQEKKNHEKNK